MTTRRYRTLISIALTTLFAIAVVPTVLAQGATGPPSQALLEDAASYADIFDVTLDEAVQRLRLQEAAGALSGELAEQEDGFAGLWIEHVPEFRVITRFRAPEVAEARLQERVAGGPLAGRIEVRRAALSLTQLEDRLVVARHTLRQHDVKADLAVDVHENRVNVYTPDPIGLEMALAAAGSRLPSAVTVVEVPELSQPYTTIPIGGSPASTCTWGFNVTHNDGRRGLSTAAHCDNTQAYGTYTVPFVAQDQEGSQDVQWHAPSCKQLDVRNDFESGIGTRGVTATRSRANQAIGALVCKYGATTGRTCGILEHKTHSVSWVTNSNATFMYLDGDNVNGQTVRLGDFGDSGAPCFVETYAYGILIGGNGNDAIYMAIDYISSLGVSVLTYDPGTCNDSPVASFTRTARLSDPIIDFDASASYDPDGSIVTYYWDFGDGYTLTTTSPTTSHLYSDCTTYTVRLRVTDDQSSTDDAVDSVTTRGCEPKDPFEQEF